MARPASGEPLLTRRDPLALLGIFCLALSLRMAHLHEIRLHDPFFANPSVDGQAYHAWARAIARGDLVGEGVIILGPFYAYAMALVYALFGESLFALKFLQAVIGAVDCLLVAVLARQYFSRAAAFVAAGIAALYGMSIFYGGTVMLVNALVPLTLLWVIAATVALRRPTLVAWAAAGLLTGCAALARQNALLFAPLLLAWLFWALRERVSLRRRAALAAVYVAAIALCIVPFSVRNRVVAGDWVLLNSTGGISLYMGNNERARGIWIQPDFPWLRADSPAAMQAAFRQVAEERTGRALAPSEVSAFWTREALAFVRHAPLDWLSLELRKLLFFWNAREVWINRSYEISRDFSWVLRLPLLSFGVVAPLALLGLALSARRWRELFPLHAAIAVYLASALLFYVASRYRMPVVPVLMVFAGHAIVRLFEIVRARQTRAALLAAAGLTVCWVLVHVDLGQETLFMAHYNLGNKYRALGRYEEAVRSYERSLEISPNFLPTHNNLALAYEGAGRPEDAVRRWRYVYQRARAGADDTRAERALRHLRKLGAAPDPAPDPLE